MTGTVAASPDPRWRRRTSAAARLSQTNASLRIVSTASWWPDPLAIGDRAGPKAVQASARPATCRYGRRSRRQGVGLRRLDAFNRAGLALVGLAGGDHLAVGRDQVEAEPACSTPIQPPRLSGPPAPASDPRPRRFGCQPPAVSTSHQPHTGLPIDHAQVLRQAQSVDPGYRRPKDEVRNRHHPGGADNRHHRGPQPLRASNLAAGRRLRSTSAAASGCLRQPPR